MGTRKTKLIQIQQHMIHAMNNQHRFFFRTLVFLSLFPGFQAKGQVTSCTWTVSNTTFQIDGRENASMIKPGDTICLAPETWEFLIITHLHGTPDAPIVIINGSGKVTITGFYYGIRIDSCSYLKLSGKGISSLPYGILITENTGNGISIEGLSTDIEIEGIEITQVGLVGIMAKSDPDCNDFRPTRDKYTMRNLIIHDNWIHITGMEGMYIGNTSYTGMELPACDTIVFPHLIRGVQIHHNKIEYTGWDGIQVASSDSGCSVSHNQVSYDSQEEYWYQMSGIFLGGGSRCDCYNNVIKDGKGDGINVFGLGDQKIYNNLIVNAGRSYYPDSMFYPYRKSGIFIGEVVTTPGAGYLTAYNTVVRPKIYGVDYQNYISTGNLIINNIIIEPGEGYLNGINVTLTNNSTLTSLQYDQFVNPGSGNYDLAPTSSCVDKAQPVSNLNLSFDLPDRTRPFSKARDIGAYECHDSSLIYVEEIGSRPATDLQVFDADPTDQRVEIRFQILWATYLELDLYNLSGKMIRELIHQQRSPGIYSLVLETSGLISGVYILNLSTQTENISKKIIIKN